MCAIEESSVTIVNVGYRSTNYWVISAGTSRLLVDLGWPGTIGNMRRNLQRMGIPLDEIRYGLATHYHMDHAGLAQELKQLGMPLLVVDVQIAAIPRMKRMMKPQDRYVEITMHDNVDISTSESRMLLSRIGIGGEILHTPGHSDDSVSLLLDDGSVFTGDLTRPGFACEDDAQVVADSWQRLRERGAMRVYPAHGPPRPIDTSDPTGAIHSPGQRASCTVMICAALIHAAARFADAAPASTSALIQPVGNGLVSYSVRSPAQAGTEPNPYRTLTRRS